MKKCNWVCMGFLALLMMGILVACGSSTSSSQSASSNAKISGDLWENDTKTSEGDPAGAYIILAINEDEASIRFYNVNLSRVQTYNYTMATTFYNAYGGTISRSKLEPGDTVAVSLYSGTYELSAVAKSSDAWEMTDLQKYSLTLDDSVRYITIGTTKYQLADSCVAFSGGEQIDLTSISDTDVISVRGFDRKVYAIVVETGHGTVTLTGTKHFEGGVVIIGNQMSATISKDMSLDVREGTYQLSVANENYAGSVEIEVVAGENTEVNLSQFGETVTEEKYGEVTFQLTPEGTTLKINGAATDYSEPVKLAYGAYVIQMRAEGMGTVQRVLWVHSAKATVSLDVAELVEEDAADAAEEAAEAAAEESESESSSSSSSGSTSNSTSTTTSSTDLDELLESYSTSTISSLLDSILSDDDDSNSVTSILSTLVN